MQIQTNKYIDLTPPQTLAEALKREGDPHLCRCGAILMDSNTFRNHVKTHWNKRY